MDDGRSSEEALFIFDPSEFEQQDFSCASFVVKYQQVVPLVNLKQDLQLFLEHLRQQLYDVVNQNYSDFINIAVKLEGVDMRISCIQSPLSSLRMDVNGLYDLIISTLTTFQNTLRSKRSLYERKYFLQHALTCMDHIDIVDQIISPSLSSDCKYPSFQSRHRRNQLQQSLMKMQSSASGKDTHMCSEIERAAFLLSDADSVISGVALSSSEEDAQEDPRSRRFASMQRDVLERLHSSRNKLLVKISERLTEVLQAGVTHPVYSTSQPPNQSLFSHRSLLHLVRALVSLRKGEVCEQIVAERVVHPLLRTTLTQGRVDGPEGRNSFSGLPSALEHMMSDISSRLGNAVICCEMEFADNGADLPVDIVLHGIWLPVMTHLESRFEGLFSSAIASTFHVCYSSVEWLSLACASLGGESFAPVIRRRLGANKHVQDFHRRWKLDLYVLVRHSLSVMCRINTMH